MLVGVGVSTSVVLVAVGGTSEVVASSGAEDVRVDVGGLSLEISVVVEAGVVVGVAISLTVEAVVVTGVVVEITASSVVDVVVVADAVLVGTSSEVEVDDSGLSEMMLVLVEVLVGSFDSSVEVFTGSRKRDRVLVVSAVSAVEVGRLSSVVDVSLVVVVVGAEVEVVVSSVSVEVAVSESMGLLIGLSEMKFCLVEVVVDSGSRSVVLVFDSVVFEVSFGFSTASLVVVIIGLTTASLVVGSGVPGVGATRASLVVIVLVTHLMNIQAGSMLAPPVVFVDSSALVVVDSNVVVGSAVAVDVSLVRLVVEDAIGASSVILEVDDKDDLVAEDVVVLSSISGVSVGRRDLMVSVTLVVSVNLTVSVILVVSSARRWRLYV